jgi:hypothetical protein
MHHLLLRQLQSAKNEKAFSWYTNRGHDVISALRTNPPLRLALLHVGAHPDGNCEFDLLSRAAQLNVLADQPASEVLEDLRAAGKRTEFYPLPACRVYLRDGAGYITSREKRTHAHERIH